MRTAVARWWARDTREWGLDGRVALFLVAAPVAVILLGVLAIPVRPIYRILVNEDGLGEWLQVGMLLAMLVLYLRLALALWRQDQRLLAGVFLVGVIVTAFIIGEEVSWGQRLFGWATPEAFDEINDQGETNVHNISGVLRLFNVAVLSLSGLALLLPILRWTVWRDRARGLVGFLVVPPLALIPAFAMAFAYRVVRIPTPDAQYVLSRFGELAELCFYFGLAAFAWVSLAAVRRLATDPEPVMSVATPAGTDARARPTVTGSN